MKLAIIDFNRTIYDPETGGLTSGAISTLDAIEEHGYTMILISKKEAGRDATVIDLGIADYFIETLFVDTKTPKLFMEVIVRHGAEPSDVLILGDYLYEEIRVGNTIGAKTVHFRSGKFKDLTPQGKGDQPMHTITHLHEITELL